MTLAVLIPWAGDCPYRVAALDWVVARYGTLGWPVIIGEGDPDAWSKGAAVADALTKTDAQILVVADGDVWADDIEQAVRHVADGRAAWSVPHMKVHRLMPKPTEEVLGGANPNPRMRHDRTPYTGVIGGGVVVLPRGLYDQVPIDPRFVGWGGEDYSWGYALCALAGMPRRENGRLWHLWHPKQERKKQVGVCATADSERLRRLYRRAQRAGDVDTVRDLIEEGRQWMSHGSSTGRQRSTTGPNPTTSTNTATS